MFKRHGMATSTNLIDSLIDRLVCFIRTILRPQITCSQGKIKLFTQFKASPPGSSLWRQWAAKKSKQRLCLRRWVDLLLIICLSANNWQLMLFHLSPTDALCLLYCVVTYIMLINNVSENLWQELWWLIPTVIPTAALRWLGGSVYRPSLGPFWYPRPSCGEEMRAGEGGVASSRSPVGATLGVCILMWFWVSFCPGYLASLL